MIYAEDFWDIDLDLDLGTEEKNMVISTKKIPERCIKYENDYYTDELTISTLSFGVDNVDSLLNLINGGYVGKLRILASVFFLC